MNAALVCHSLQVFLSCRWVAILKIVLNCVIEKDSILWHYNDVLTERFESQVFQVLSINANLSLCWIIDSEK